MFWSNLNGNRISKLFIEANIGNKSLCKLQTRNKNEKEMFNQLQKIKCTNYLHNMPPPVAYKKK